MDIFYFYFYKAQKLPFRMEFAVTCRSGFIRAKFSTRFPVNKRRDSDPHAWIPLVNIHTTAKKSDFFIQR